MKAPRKSSPRPSYALCVLIVLIAAGGPQGVEGQVIRGSVRDVSTQRGVSGAIVVMGPGDAGKVESVTDSTGSFTTRVPRVGVVEISASALGYRGSDAMKTVVGPKDTVEVEILLSPVPITLPALRIISTTRVRSLVGAGFYERELLGTGHFIHPGAIRASNARSASDLLRGISGVRVVRRGSGNDMLMRAPVMGALLNRNCFPAVYLDNMPIRQGGSQVTGATGEMNIDAIIRPQDIEAIEVYRGESELPPQYGGSSSGCGAIIIWSRKGG